MNEHDLREALRAGMTVTPPPPMASAVAVAAGRRAVRRRAALAGAGATAAVLMATAVAVNASGPPAGTPWAAPAAPSGEPAPIGTPSAAGEDTEPAWPLDGDGRPQEDATARSGERYEQGRKLLGELLEVVPEGWDVPEGEPDDEIPLRTHQAQVEGDNTGKTWGYLAYAAITRGAGTGQLLAEVHTRDNGLPTGPCELAGTFWGLGDRSCTVVTAGGREVALATGGDSRIDQWAAYRHPDGVVVFVAQSRKTASGQDPLTEPPLSGARLAALAVDERFHLQ